jgi:hypothetical protein
MSKIAIMALALTLVGGAALAQNAPAPSGQNTAYAQLVSKMDEAYHMQFKVPGMPEQTAARAASAKTAG